MSTEVRTVSPDDGFDRAAEVMSERGVRRLPAVEGGRRVGVLSRGNLMPASGGPGPAGEATTGVTRGA